MSGQIQHPSGQLAIDTGADSDAAAPHKPHEYRPTVKPRTRWQSLPVRWQLMISISIISVGAVLLSIVLAVVDARDRVEVEVNSSMELAHRLVKDALGRANATAPEALKDLFGDQMAYVRHARVLVSDDHKDFEQVAPDERIIASTHRPEPAPQWFADLVGPSVGTRQIKVMLNGGRVGGVAIVGEPRDELGEVWEEVSRRAVIWLGITALMLALLYFVLGRLLNPLVALAGSMQELEDGHYGTRVPEPAVKELGVIAHQFNTLAEALEKARAENSRLYSHLIAVQEEERRRIANDLHDEAGPCLFGITANVASIARLAAMEPNAQSQPIKTRVDEVLGITERLKTINRDLLRNLRPVEIGRIPLTELIGSLVATFERRHPECTFVLSFGDVAQTYGEEADIAIFRCVQESLTNVVKHAEASRVSIQVATHPETKTLRIEISDDGKGMRPGVTPGLGITAMRERIRSLNGTSNLASSTRGTTVIVDLPSRPKETGKRQPSQLNGTTS